MSASEFDLSALKPRSACQCVQGKSVGANCQMVWNRLARLFERRDNLVAVDPVELVGHVGPRLEVETDGVAHPVSRDRREHVVLHTPEVHDQLGSVHRGRRILARKVGDVQGDDVVFVGHRAGSGDPTDVPDRAPDGELSPGGRAHERRTVRSRGEAQVDGTPVAEAQLTGGKLEDDHAFAGEPVLASAELVSEELAGSEGSAVVLRQAIDWLLEREAELRGQAGRRAPAHRLESVHVGEAIA